MEEWYLVEGWGGGEIVATVKGDASKAYKRARELSKKLGSKIIVCQPFDYPLPQSFPKFL